MLTRPRRSRGHTGVPASAVAAPAADTMAVPEPESPVAAEEPAKPAKPAPAAEERAAANARVLVAEEQAKALREARKKEAAALHLHTDDDGNIVATFSKKPETGIKWSRAEDTNQFTIALVVPDSPAAKQHLRVGMILLKVGDKDVSSGKVSPAGLSHFLKSRPLCLKFELQVPEHSQLSTPVDPAAPAPVPAPASILRVPPFTSTSRAPLSTAPAPEPAEPPRLNPPGRVSFGAPTPAVLRAMVGRPRAGSRMHPRVPVSSPPPAEVHVEEAEPEPELGTGLLSAELDGPPHLSGWAALRAQQAAATAEHEGQSKIRAVFFVARTLSAIGQCEKEQPGGPQWEKRAVLTPVLFDLLLRRPGCRGRFDRSSSKSEAGPRACVPGLHTRRSSMHTRRSHAQTRPNELTASGSRRPRVGTGGQAALPLWRAVLPAELRTPAGVRPPT